MRLGSTSLSVTKPGAVRKYAAASSSSSSSDTLPDIDTYTHVRHDVINTGSYNCSMAELSPDGTKVYTLHRRSSSYYYFYQQNLSTAFDISSYGSVTNSFNVRTDGATMSAPSGFRFVDNGSKLYFSDFYGRVKQYNLSTPWDTSSSSRSYIKQLDITNGSTNGIFWKPDGSTMFYVDKSYDKIYARHVSTSWDIDTDTATDSSIDLDLSGTLNENSASDLYFSNNGLKLYIMAAGNDYVYQYNLSTAWDITSFSGAADKSLYVGNVETNPVGLHFSPDGTHMYISGSTGNGVDQFVSS